MQYFVYLERFDALKGFIKKCGKTSTVNEEQLKRRHPGATDELAAKTKSMLAFFKAVKCTQRS